MLYAAMQVNNTGKVVAFGRSMQPMAVLQQQLVNAQQSMEREYSARAPGGGASSACSFKWPPKQCSSSTPQPLKVIEVNPAAAKLLGRGQQAT